MERCAWVRRSGTRSQTEVNARLVSLLKKITTILVNFLPPATKLGQGNIFRSVCQEFCSQEWGIPACLAGLQARTQGGGLGVLPAGSPGPQPEGSPDPHPGGSPGPHLGGLQAHTWRGVSRPTPRGVSRFIPRGRVCIPAYTEAEPPPPAAGGTHPTGMHSCCGGILQIFEVH